MAIINKTKYIAELTKLLGFMSSWDRQAVIQKYSRLFDSAENQDELIEQLGTPTRLAVELAADYVSTPPPAMETFSPDVEINSFSPDENATEDENALPEARDADDESVDALPEEAAAAPARKARPVALAFYAPASLIIGLPVALVCLLPGLPFAALGAGAIVLSVGAAIDIVAMLALISDKLFAVGAAAVISGVGLLAVWFGLWLSITLCRLWVGKCVFGLGRRICFRKGGDSL